MQVNILQSKMSFLKLEYMQISNCDVCPEISGIEFPSLYSRKLCLVGVLFCVCVWEKILLPFISVS